MNPFTTGCEWGSVAHGVREQHIPDDHVFDSLELHAFAPYPATFTLYEDDGLTRAYERGDFAKTTFTVSESETGCVIDVTPEVGDWRPAFASPQIAVVLRSAWTPQGVAGVAGASLTHPHSQLIATGIVPRHIRWQEDEARRYFDEWGRCIYCDVLAFEANDRRRVIMETPHFLAFVPYAAEVPFETWIVPKRHHADFEQITEAEQHDLATTLHAFLVRLCDALHDPDYNSMIITSIRRGADEYLHWYVRVRPRLVTRAGFEIGSGIRINPSLPEDDAAVLRGE